MSADYPRMMFHRLRTKQPVIINSREEEEELGAEWTRIYSPAAEEPPASPSPVEENGESEEPDEEPEEPEKPAPRKKAAPKKKKV